MSAIALNNRVTSDSEAAFASCTALPIHQTTLNAEEMAGIDGLCLLEEVLSTVQDIASEIGAVVDDAATTASIAIFGGDTYQDLDPTPSDTLNSSTQNSSTQNTHICITSIELITSYGTCYCQGP